MARTAPAQVAAPAGVKFTRISVGSYTTCGLTTAGAIYCWGRNEGGLLGDGSTADRLDPRPVIAPPGVTFTTLAVSPGAFACATGSDEAGYCWGAINVWDGTDGYRLVPARLRLPDGVGLVSIVAGGIGCGVTPGWMGTVGATATWAAPTIPRNPGARLG